MFHESFPTYDVTREGLRALVSRIQQCLLSGSASAPLIPPIFELANYERPLEVSALLMPVQIWSLHHLNKTESSLKWRLCPLCTPLVPEASQESPGKMSEKKSLTWNRFALVPTFASGLLCDLQHNLCFSYL